MFDEPQEDPVERSFNATDRVKDKTDEFRMHAELAAVFEAGRKFEAQVIPGLDMEVARTIQRRIATLAKARSSESPVVPETSMPEASALFEQLATADLSTNDYHIHRRPGEVMMIRWLSGEQVETFYTRLQAHFDAAMNAYRQEQRTDNEWKKDPDTLAYLDALDAVELKMADRYLRPMIQQHNLFVLSTQTVDEMSIAHLVDYIMGMPAAEVVGAKSAPPEEPTERDLTWFFKLFSLRGSIEGVEKMCFFTFLQKSDDEYEF